jgi:hypothetical protein
MNKRNLLIRLRKAVGEENTKQLKLPDRDLNVVPAHYTPFNIDSIVTAYGLYEFFKCAREKIKEGNSEISAQQYWYNYDFKNDWLGFRKKVPILYQARFFTDDFEPMSDAEIGNRFGPDVPFQCKYHLKSNGFVAPLINTNDIILGESAKMMPSHVLGNFKVWNAGKMGLVSSLTKDFGKNPVEVYNKLYKKFESFCNWGILDNQQRQGLPKLNSFLRDESNFKGLRDYTLLQAFYTKALGLRNYEQVKTCNDLENIFKRDKYFCQHPKYVVTKDEVGMIHPSIEATPKFILEITRNVINYADKCISELKK